MTDLPPVAGDGARAPAGAGAGGWARHPAVRALRRVLPAPARAALWRAARAAKRARNRLVRRLPRRLRRRLGGRWAPPPPPAAALRVRPGKFLPPEQGDLVPVVMLVALGMDAGEVDATVDAVAWQQAMHLSFVPLFVIDVADTRVFRRHGYLYEYVMPFDEWARFNDPELWPGFVQRRLEELVDTYRPATVTSLNLMSRFGGVALGLTPQPERRG